MPQIDPALMGYPSDLRETSLSRPEIAGPIALEREWLVTNGLGGFACGTISQANTRRYHGLLIASLRPPVERILMMAKVDITARYRDETFELATNEYADGTLTPRGFEQLGAFHLELGLPVWTYLLGDAVLEQRIWMAHARNTTHVSLLLRHATAAMQLTLLPLCSYRDYHSHSHGGWSLNVQSQERGCTIVALEGARPYRLWTDRGEFIEDHDWYWGFHHRMEAARGLDAGEDLFRPGLFTVGLEPGETATFTVTADVDPPEAAAKSFERERLRRQHLTRSAPSEAPEWIRRLTLAADQFIVSRSPSNGTPGTTVIAGYPWFSDWGRDTMIALPGLTLATARQDDGASILRTFAGYVSQGMLPNRFPDDGDVPEYNTVDATLWYFHAIQSYLQRTKDGSLLRELYPVLKEIIDCHRRGTRFSIHVDPSDGLLYAGEAGTQLTWMDARSGDRVVTARMGKPVEINALWHYALLHMATWARTQSDPDSAKTYAEMAHQVAHSFEKAFWFEQGGHLYDVVDTPEVARENPARHADASLRPNQIFAVSLGTDLLSPDHARAVVDTCSKHLVTPVGLRTLAPGAPRYAGTYSGGPRDRDAVYHQGTVWGWLLGPYALAHYRVYHNVNHALTLLSGLVSHLDEGCLGSISEIFDGAPPHQPRGCFAQAWSVSETLRAWHTLTNLPRSTGD
jgi:predicted glycogen debranching enzyme